MEKVFLALQLAISVLLIGAILVQAKGVGLGRAWGGSGEFYATRRGVEKVLFYATIVLVAIFAILSFSSVLRFS